MSKIEWTEVTWNPVTGCTKISEGCQNCYAERMANRLQHNPKTDKYRNGFAATYHPEELNKLSQYRKGKIIFVCSMGDLFHADITNEQLESIFTHMQGNPQHIYIILTKRAERMNWIVRYLTSRYTWDWKNFIFGVTVENQKSALRVFEGFMGLPGTHMVSVEPMLESIILPDGPLIDWVICGAETGPGKRPFEITWASYLNAQCYKSDIPFFFKKDGSGKYDDEFPREYPDVIENFKP